ncbi:MAG: hypothetical protein V2I39_09500, partial [Erythrobacter sp.]|nr:hypothetical protein [Erythrobacter sp.]
MADEQPDQAALPSEEEAEAQQGRGGRLLRRLGKVVGLGLLAVAGLVVLILAGLNTAPGKRFIADQVAGLEFENGLEIGIGRITGSIYGEMVLHDLVLSDPQGAFLTSPEVRVDWRPFAYLDNHIEVRSAAAQRMTLLRLPEFRETPPSDEPLLPDLDITIGALRIDRFVAEPAVTGEQRVATLAGRILIRDRRAQARVGARTLDAGGAAGGDRLILALDAVPEANRL